MASLGDLRYTKHDDHHSVDALSSLFSCLFPHNLQHSRAYFYGEPTVYEQPRHNVSYFQSFLSHLVEPSCHSVDAPSSSLQQYQYMPTPIIGHIVREATLGVKIVEKRNTKSVASKIMLTVTRSATQLLPLLPPHAMHHSHRLKSLQRGRTI